MDNIRNAAIERLLSGYRRYYNVTRFDGGPNPPPEEFKGICEAGKLTPPAFSIKVFNGKGDSLPAAED